MTSAQETSENASQKDVLFYVLNSTDPQSREVFLSKLLKKIWQEKRLCDIRFESEQNALRYDLTLWNAQPHSFIPHSVKKQTRAPIQLYGDNIPHPCNDVLINLHPDFSPQFSSYQRTIEVLDQSEYLIQKGRTRWKNYVAQG
ncbi:MAG: DNA polymerase III subunit chi, partial [Gammaproteobacteria bacterium]|nr:DNA polymerase III subunit chi [Gammaproteobacteria bacterium]